MIDKNILDNLYVKWDEIKYEILKLDVDRASAKLDGAINNNVEQQIKINNRIIDINKKIIDLLEEEKAIIDNIYNIRNDGDKQ